MTDQLSLYNGALEALGERHLASLTENREPRRKLNDVWARNAVKTCLEEGQWNFATRSSKFSYSPSISPASFGYQNGFEKPDDWVRTTGVCNDEYFKLPLLEYQEDAGVWWADLDTIYVRYVSSDAQYGLDYAKWPHNFTRFVEHFLARSASKTIMGASFDTSQLDAELKSWKAKAKATDAMEEPARFKPHGSWTRSRQQRRGDRGRRDQLIG
jgi:hypothetical protein